MDAKNLIDELNLKTTIAVMGIVEDERRGIITKAQAATAMKGIFDAVSGLVSQDTFDLISAASEEYKGAKGMEATFIKHEDKIIGTIRICGAGALLRFSNGVPLRTPQDNSEREVDAEAKTEQVEYHKQLLIAARRKQEQGSW